MRADRLLQIVTLLRVHGRLSAGELARRLEVTPRTVLRDMEALSGSGVPVYAERGRDGGFALLPGYRPAVEELTAAETEALLLSPIGVLDRMGRSATLASAVRKLSGAVAPELTRAAEHVADRVLVDPTGWFSRAEPLPYFDTVQTAVLTDRRLRLGYQPKDPGRTGVRTVDPYGLVQAAGTWYLLAAHRGRPRTYRIGRISSATLLSAPSGRPEDLDLPALWRRLRGEFVRPAELTIRLEVCDRRPSELMIMLAAVGAGRPRLEDGPPMIMEAEVLETRSAVAAVAGLGARVKVLDPPELLSALRTTLRDGEALYADQDGPVGQPPATAGMIETLAPSPTSASSPPTNRTSSSPM